MCRLRIPNGILKHWQFAGVADLSERYAGGFAHVTTRANLQIREIEPKNAINMVEGIQDLGLCSRGSGADNIRNVTGTPTAGIDPQELIDTRPYAREWHFHILNDRTLYGIPRKFNVGFDGAGVIAVLEDTNDIGFAAVAVKDGFGVEPGVWFRLGIGGITGHRDFTRDTGVIVKPAEATAVADAVVRVFIDHGDRTNRTKARLKYVLDAFGIEKFLGLMEEKLGRKLVRVANEAIAPRPACDRFGHIGVHPQKQDELNWLGVVLPVGRMTAAQMRGLAAVARDFGDGDIRLTVWQNFLISGVPTARVAAAQEAIGALGLTTAANSIRSGLVACTGNTGCKFAASDTKRHAEEIAAWCETRVAVDAPVNTPPDTAAASPRRPTMPPPRRDAPSSRRAAMRCRPWWRWRRHRRRPSPHEPCGRRRIFSGAGAFRPGAGAGEPPRRMRTHVLTENRPGDCVTSRLSIFSYITG
jgi:ferredoxin-nitrite reductase